MNEIILKGDQLTLDQLWLPLRGPIKVKISSKAITKLYAARKTVERHLNDKQPSYGINTGFGIFANRRIAPSDLLELQRNLVLSHSAGVGPPLSDSIVRTMMLAKLHGLCLGFSGVRVEVVECLAEWLNKDCLPVVPSQGSVGASGDLAPLAHMTLALMGEGEARYQGKQFKASALIKKLKLPKLNLEAKEGLGLLNGTQAILAVGAQALYLVNQILAHADIAAALTVEGMFDSVTPFDERLHKVRPHVGAIHVASVMRKLLVNSKIVASHANCERVQDPYAIRCVPAVHGTALDAYTSAANTFEIELNSVTDNPVVFAQDDKILSGGNFHGAPLAFAMDYVAIALTTLASISERRTEQLINPKSGELPNKGLTSQPGLHSGYMVAHTTAAALVSENKTLAHPASVDTIPTWAGQEDHVSMGMWGARKALQIAQNSVFVVAIELVCAAQAIDLHDEILSPGKGTKIAYDLLRKQVPPMLKDRIVSPDLNAIAALVESGNIRESIEKKLGKLW